jgi:hypothetical protein
LGLEISRTIARGTLVMIDGGFTLVGEPKGVDYHDTWWYDVGVGQNLANDVINLSVFFEQYRSIVPGVPNARDILVAVSVGAARGWRMQISGDIGLSDGAADHGFTFGASRRF